MSAEQRWPLNSIINTNSIELKGIDVAMCFFDPIILFKTYNKNDFILGFTRSWKIFENKISMESRGKIVIFIKGMENYSHDCTEN